jgi:hypothetical protein
VQALTARGRTVRHCIEDVDVAFTEVGAGAGGSGSGLRLERERHYRGGEADWGAALFYHQFLGRLPVDVREWEPFTGLSTKALAGRLRRTMDELYDEFSPSDNWQLIGPSYVGDGAHHRVLGDLSVAEAAEFVREVLRKARDDASAALPDAPCQQRLAEWFDREEATVESLLARHADGPLVDLYRDWMAAHNLGSAVSLDLTSRLFGVEASPARFEALEAFLRDYDQAAGLYNQAIAEAFTSLRPLDTARGELPFFAVLPHDGHLVRTLVHLDRDQIRIGTRTFALGADRRLPLAALAEAGVRAVSGKAILLAIQVRLGEGGEALALPYRGSAYMPASHRLAAKLVSAGLLTGPLAPIVRVRLRLLDRLAGLDVSIRLPAHLARAFGREVVAARELAGNHARLAEEAMARLQRLKDPAARADWQRRNLPKIGRELEELDARRRRLAQATPKDPELRLIWKRIKPLQLEALRRTLGQIADDWQVRDVDYWDSRGAILPWCIGLGGAEFYNRVIRQAEIYDEHES